MVGKLVTKQYNSGFLVSPLHVKCAGLGITLNSSENVSEHSTLATFNVTPTCAVFAGTSNQTRCSYNVTIIINNFHLFQADFRNNSLKK